MRHYRSSTAVATLASGGDAVACEMLSTGRDRTLRMFHSALDRQNREMSQGHLAKRARELSVAVDTLRLPLVTALAVNDRQFSVYPDVLTAHDHDYRAFCWNYDAKCIGTAPPSLALPAAVVFV